MPGELERLLIRLEADTSLMRRAFADADKQVAGFAARVDRNLVKSEKRVRTSAVSMAGDLKRLAAAYGLVRAASSALAAVNAVGDINDMARAAGLGTKSFQELAFAARQAGIDQGALAQATRMFSVNMAQLRVGAGSLNNLLKEHLPTLQAQLQHTKSQEEAFGVLADAIQRLRSDEERTTLAQAAFGKSGSDLVEVLNSGAAGLANMAEKARSLHVIQSTELLNSAEQLKKQYEALGATIEAAWQRGVVSAADYAKMAVAALKLGGSNAGVLAGANAAAPNKGLIGPPPEGTNRFAFAGDNAGGATIPNGDPLQFTKSATEEVAKAKQAWEDLRAVSLDTINQLINTNTVPIEDKIEAITDAVKGGRIGWRDYLGAMQEVNGRSQDQMQQLATATSQTLTAVFKESKAAAIASAMINTAQGVTLAFAKLEPPFSFAMAALTAAQGFAQVAAIRNTNYSGGQASGGAAPVSSASAAVPAAQTAVAPSQTLFVKGLSGSGIWSTAMVRDLAEKLVEFQRNGGKVVLA